MKLNISVILSTVFVTCVYCQNFSVSKITEITGLAKLIISDKSNYVYVVTKTNKQDHLFKYDTNNNVTTEMKIEVQTIVDVMLNDRNNVYFLSSNDTPSATWYHVIKPGDDQWTKLMYKTGGKDFASRGLKVLTDGENIYVRGPFNSRMIKPDDSVIEINGMTDVYEYKTDHLGNLYVVQNVFSVLPVEEKSKDTPRLRQILQLGSIPASTHIAPDSHNNVYIAHDQFLMFHADFDEIETISEDRFFYLQIDELDTVYAAGVFGNIYIKTAEDEIPRIFMNQTFDPLFDFYLDSSKNIYFVCEDGRTYFKRNDSEIATRIVGIPNSIFVQQASLDNFENFLVLGEELYVYIKGSETAKRVNGLPYGEKKMIVDPKNNVFVLTEDGIYRVNY